MVLFVGEMPQDTEYLVWDLFFLKGSVVLFRVAMTILKLMHDSIAANDSYENIMSTISSLSRTKVTRQVLLKNLAKYPKHSEIHQLRQIYRVQVIQGLTEEMSRPQTRLFPRSHFLGRFLLVDGLAKYNQDMKLI
jgi:hypothetical protein